MHRRDPAQDPKRLEVALQERLLALRPERPVDCPARVRQPEREQEHLRPDPGQVDPQVGEVDFTFRARSVGLRDEHLLQHVVGARNG